MWACHSVIQNTTIIFNSYLKDNESAKLTVLYKTLQFVKQFSSALKKSNKFIPWHSPSCYLIDKSIEILIVYSSKGLFYFMKSENVKTELEKLFYVQRGNKQDILYFKLNTRVHKMADKAEHQRDMSRNDMS